MVNDLQKLPEQVEAVLETSIEIEELARSWVDVRDYFFLGRSGDFPVAMEGALKFGPIALIEDGVVVVGVATDSHVGRRRTPTWRR